MGSLSDAVSGPANGSIGSPFYGASQPVLNAYNQGVVDPRNIAGNMQDSYATSKAVAQMTPDEYAAFQERYADNNNDNGFWGVMNSKILPAIIMGVATGGVGAGVGSAVGGGLGGSIAGGAAAGATGALANSIGRGAPLTLGNVGKGVGLGALGGALAGSGIAKGATDTLTGAGINPVIAGGAVKGVIGAGAGAIGGALSGAGAGNGALIGGVGGAASGAIGAASGNPGLGAAAGTIAGGLASKYATSPPKAPAPPSAATPPVSTPAGAIPALPPAGVGDQPTNIGSYSGYGYQPRQQAHPVIDYANYGQGPEAQFFQNVGAPIANTSPTATQGMPSTPQQRI